MKLLPVTNHYIYINLASLGLALFMSILIIFFQKFLPPKLPLFYSLPWGETQLATYYQMLTLPAILSVITLLNMLLSWQLHSSQLIFKKIIHLASLLCAILFFIALLKIFLIFI